MSEIQAEFNKDKALNINDVNTGCFYLLLAIYEQNKTIIKLLKEQNQNENK